MLSSDYTLMNWLVLGGQKRKGDLSSVLSDTLTNAHAFRDDETSRIDTSPLHIISAVPQAASQLARTVHEIARGTLEHIAC